MAYFIFQLVYYSRAGSSDSWSGAWFCVNSILLMYFFSKEKSQAVKIIGVSATLSVLIFCAAKFFFGFQGERIYTLIPFLIILAGLIAIWLKKRIIR